MKIVYVLATRIASRPKYIWRSTTRQWDNRKLIELTDDIEKAKTWGTEADAADFLSKCIVNDRQYAIETHQSRPTNETPIEFTDRANKARIS